MTKPKNIMGETKNKKKSQKYQKQLENHGVSCGRKKSLGWE